MKPQVIKESKRITLKDIALESGVAVSTVSAVLGGFAAQRRISQDVAERVQAIASVRGFTPNRLVRSLQRGRTHILAFYSAFRNRWEGDLYLESLSKGIELAAGEFRYDLLTLTEHKRTPEETFAQMNGGWADGLILFGARPDEPLLPLLRRSGLPVVLLQGNDGESGWARVHEDGPQGLALLADAVAAQGHKNVMIFEMRHFAHPAWRIDEFRLQMARRGVIIPDDAVYRAECVDLKQELRDIMMSPNPPTVIFALADRLGYKLLEACDQAGISVPEQISIVGYDGIHWPSTSRHLLTSVALNMHELARASVELLDQIIQGTAESGEERVVPLTFVNGTTLGPVPSSLTSNV